MNIVYKTNCLCIAETDTSRYCWKFILVLHAKLLRVNNQTQTKYGWKSTLCWSCRQPRTNLHVSLSGFTAAPCVERIARAVGMEPRKRGKFQNRKMSDGRKKWTRFRGCCVGSVEKFHASSSCKSKVSGLRRSFITDGEQQELPWMRAVCARVHAFERENPYWSMHFEPYRTLNAKPFHWRAHGKSAEQPRSWFAAKPPGTQQTFDPRCSKLSSGLHCSARHSLKQKGWEFGLGAHTKTFTCQACILYFCLEKEAIGLEERKIS